MPEYRADILKTIGDVVRQQPIAFGAAQKKLPLTQASKGWKMPNMVPPSAPADGAHIYVVGNEMRWKSANGSDYSLIPVQVPVAPAVANAGNIVSGDAPEHPLEAILSGVRLDPARIAARRAQAQWMQTRREQSASRRAALMAPGMFGFTRSMPDLPAGA